MASIIKELMDSEGISQATVRRGTGINQGRLSQIMNGKAEPTKPESRKLAVFFGLSENILKGETKDESK